MTGTTRSRRWAKGTALAVVLLAAGFAAWFAHAQPELRSLPPILSTISDELGALSVPEGQRLAAKLADIERETGVTVIVVILATTGPESIEAYTHRLIQRWRRESKRLDHGRFVFVTVAKEERMLRIVSSEALGWILRPFAQSEVVVQALTLLKEDKYFESLAAIVEWLSRLLAEQDGTVPPKEERHGTLPLSM